MTSLTKLVSSAGRGGSGECLTKGCRNFLESGQRGMLVSQSLKKIRILLEFLVGFDPSYVLCLISDNDSVNFFPCILVSKTFQSMIRFIMFVQLYPEKYDIICVFHHSY